ncbi:MAG: hypothetical protein KBC27_03495, partial [Rickettsiales bacterium]|nr:hypothetical protein [Rickettsiales bacterium]
FISIASLHFFYQYLISVIVTDPSKTKLLVLIYNICVSPILAILLMYLIKEKLTYHNIIDNSKNIFHQSQRCYVRLLVYCTILTAIKLLLSPGTNFLLFLIITIKLPFVESGIYFNNQSLWESIKSSFNHTQESILRVTLTIASLALVSYLFLIKSLQVINTSTAAKTLSFTLGIAVSNFEIIGKMIIISLFLSTQQKLAKQSSI